MKHTATVLVLGILLAMASAQFAGCGSSRSVIAAGARPTSSVPSVKRVPTPQQVRNLSIFRTPAEGMPPLVSSVVGTAPHGIRWSQGQELTNALTMHVWAVPGPRFICMVSLRSVGAVGVTCRTTRDVLRSGLATTLLSEDSTEAVDRTIIGILPDSAGAIRATVIGGPTVVASNRGGWFFHSDQIQSPPDVFRLITWAQRRSA